eukprot:237555-Alexandrium_andersonii.AAC.1
MVGWPGSEKPRAQRTLKKDPPEADHLAVGEDEGRADASGLEARDRHVALRSPRAIRSPGALHLDWLPLLG